ncbi:MAG: flagellar export chaperone FlgN [Candidatus Goldbacteria bacterium]|nr:flagellar export chaperone FlgN [Candidatus Goldiibacteriota bacterium]
MKKQTKEKFLKIIDEQKKLYGSLKELIGTESKVLTDKDIKKIDGIIKQQDVIVFSIKKLEDEKNAIFNLMIEETGLPQSPLIKLKDVLERIDKNDAMEIEKAVVELISIVKEIASINAQNTNLIKNYVNYVDFVMKMKEKIEQPQTAIYTQNGNKKEIKADKDSKIDKTI